VVELLDLPGPGFWLRLVAEPSFVRKYRCNCVLSMPELKAWPCSALGTRVRLPLGTRVRLPLMLAGQTPLCQKLSCFNPVEIFHAVFRRILPDRDI